MNLSMRAIVLLMAIGVVSSQVISPSHTYNVTAPEPNAPYVAGQVLPVRYTLVDDIKLPNLLSLSIYFTTIDPSMNFTDTVITSNADISQGFSFRRTQNTMVYYEHELSYAIPNTTRAGSYQVIFVDSVSRTNTSVPIVVRPYAPPTLPSSTAAGNANKAGPSSIFAIHANSSSRKQPELFALVALILLLCAFL
ncbi:hypothetical protein J3Q64DRAFT_1727781 [Phycomyces blakesleeanus]|uniref:Secreted protein n=2 Tax=Phycomyces blakesleeanus TaxID=4837 RepID=A0A163A0J0_PHYB8|nr:hypothetical protein PHYBLDRAFT_148789 [Phycomyces blakesleeanus NRRL 1555(-)]OAD70241.1 hypothetical protein PHYBLDRAFT_148789 [Phycomyces blakesleeanus NRRL 1555(-)]|eukprot:XP_018288281.1 hypothetical protein PHYBLDRAFT_148789 [Phycomyces blakesleeanus NRRL 1555(-)]